MIQTLFGRKGWPALSNVDEGVLELQVIAVRRESSAVVSLELADERRRILPEWSPGAHVDLMLDGHVRQYSLCGDPADRRSYRVGVLREVESRGGSSWVHDELRVGDVVEVGGPRNHFELLDADEYVFVAGGIGITPILPMLCRAERRRRPWTLHYGGRSLASMAFLDDLKIHDRHVQLWPEVEHGLMALSAIVGPPRPGLAVYCCGPEPLIAAAERVCADHPNGTLRVERFAARTLTAAEIADERAFDVVASRSGRRVTVPAGRSIMDVLEESGIFLPNACRDGVCGSCLTGVIAGEPEHRGNLLGDEDAQQILPCVSRSKTPELILDL